MRLTDLNYGIGEYQKRNGAYNVPTNKFTDGDDWLGFDKSLHGGNINFTVCFSEKLRRYVVIKRKNELGKNMWEATMKIIHSYMETENFILDQSLLSAHSA